jgi:hypothetical protein
LPGGCRPDNRSPRIPRALGWSDAKGEVYVCGSNAFVEAVTGDLVPAGTHPHRALWRRRLIDARRLVYL